jgi:hypothetical protein
MIDARTAISGDVTGGTCKTVTDNARQEKAKSRIKIKKLKLGLYRDFGTFPARLMGMRSSGSVQPR